MILNCTVCCDDINIVQLLSSEALILNHVLWWLVFFFTGEISSESEINN